MESSGEAGDEQGSGWMQVKKKHRSNSKFTPQGWVGGFSGKQTSSNVKSLNSHGKYGVQHSKAGKFSVNSKSSVANATSVSNEEEKRVHYLDKRVVSQDNECPKSFLLTVAASCDNKPGVVEEPPQKDNNNLRKIKWGDLDDEAVVLHLKKNSGDDIRFGDIRNDNFVGPSSATDEVGDLVLSSVETDQSICQSLSLVSDDDDKVNEVKEVTSEDVKVEIRNGKTISSSSHISNMGKTCHEQFNLVSNELDEVLAELPAPEAEISEVPLIERVSSTVAISQEIDSFTPSKSGPEKQGESMTPAFVGDTGRRQVDRILENVSNVRSLSGIDGGDGVESKERFRQRLWCFLFENLNRAVDELYLLCELECDMEQMKEAILVLEEALSDFKELQSRVEEFEDVNRSTSQLVDGPPIMKSDHRRPHALSWEVRRMTTSPHRAEILSSSLEAFRKIQQERANVRAASDAKRPGLDCPSSHHKTDDNLKKCAGRSYETPNTKEAVLKSRKQSGVLDTTLGSFSVERRNSDLNRPSRKTSTQSSHLMVQNPSSSGINVSGKSKREQQVGYTCETEKLLSNKKDKMSAEILVEKCQKSVDHNKKQPPLCEKDKERRNRPSWKSMDAWKEKRNWEDVLYSRYSYSPGVSRRSAERARTLHDKLMSPEKKKKNALDLKKDAEEKHARAMRIRSELENERVQKLQRNSQKLNRVNEWLAVRSIKLREGMHARHQRGEYRHEAFLAQVVRRAGDESSKVNEVRFITSLNEENKKLILRQKLHDSELRRAEKLQVIKTKQKEDMAREEAVLERKKVIEAEKLLRLAETQRKKEEALVRREEERKASSAAREAKAIEQMRRKEVRAKAQQEEAELLAQKLAERLSESEQRRKFYLEQIRERASMDIRDQSSPLLRRSLNKEGLGRSTATSSGGEEYHANNVTDSGDSTLQNANGTLQHSLKRRIKRIRQKLMALKYEFPEPPVGENAGIAYRTAVGTARAKLGRWLQELQRLRQARKEGAASIGLITADMIKFLEAKDPELQATRQAGLLDFIASALPASHTSKPEACQVTIYLLRLLRVVLSVPANRSYFLAQNLLPPIIPMLAAALENYIKIAASSNVPGSSNLASSKTSVENLESMSEALDGFLWTVATIIGHGSSDECQLQMQDGLQELVVAYQVIHRLRDLFALYDRPQVEGSPFPSSILLGINLLAVFTSRSRTTSSIDFETFPIQAVAENETSKDKLVEAADFGCSSATDPSGDNRPQPYALNGSIVLPLPDLPEGRPLDGPCAIGISNKSVLDEKHFNKLEGIRSEMNGSDTQDESRQGLVDNIAKSFAAKKDTVNDSAGKNVDKLGLKPPVTFLLSAISETGLVCLPSLLTAVLLQANNRLSSEQASHVLPSNFEEVATGVLKVLNNLALIDITFMQRMLARPDLKMEFFHLMSFLLSHCTSKWRVVTDQVGLLLLEALLQLGYFSLFHPENQSVLRWGKSPTILHKVCDLPFVFFSDPDLMPILAGTLVAACFGCERNKCVVQQELSIDMLISLLRSCRDNLPDNPPTECPSNSNQLGSESRKLLVHGETPLRSNRCNIKSTQFPSGKGSSASLASFRTSKMRNQKDSRALKLCEEMSVKKNQLALETSSTLMLHSRFSGSFIDRAEQFFAAGTTE